MELPNIGEHCSEATCNRLDFLPVKCDACGNCFCKDHMTYTQHACPKAHAKDVQVPVCPLCNSPVVSPRNEAPDIAVGDHIDRNCQSDPARAKRKKNENKCKAQGCKVREIIPVLCAECRLNFCIRHRFPDDHRCEGKRAQAARAAERRLNAGKSVASMRTDVQGSMSEDEALARAIAESMKDSGPRRQPIQTNSQQRCHVS